MGGPAADDTPLAGDRRSLYVADGRAILRLDPATGAVLADQQHPAGDGPAMSLFRAGIDGGALWTSPTASGRVVTLHRLDLATLRPLATVTFPLPGRFSPEDLITVSANAPHDRMYVGAGHTVTVIDAATLVVVNHYQLTGPAIGDIAVNPADTRLYVTQTTERDTTTVTALDPSTGTRLAKPAPLPNPGGVLAATSGGVWLLTGSGMTDDLEFAPASDPSHLSQPLTGAGGGFPVTSTATANVVWLGGTSNIACADPLTGRIRATARVPGLGGYAANVSALTPAGNRLFARYQADNGPSNLLVTLAPPARCTR